MVALFRRDNGEELEQLRATVEQLGETTVDGLAAALSWRARKTERWLAEELRRPGTPLAYDPVRRSVRWAIPELAAPALSSAVSLSPPPPEAEAETPAPVADPIGPLPRANCPRCHVPLHPATNGTFSVCPKCGRVSTRRTLEAAVSPPTAPTAPSVEAPPSTGEDRRHQEMLAAYVTSRPIPCPRCRTPLRHRSLAEYVCPACGRVVHFPAAPPGGRPNRGTSSPSASPSADPADPPSRASPPPSIRASESGASAPPPNAPRSSYDPRGSSLPASPGSPRTRPAASFSRAHVPAFSDPDESPPLARPSPLPKGLRPRPPRSPGAPKPAPKAIPRLRSSCRIPSRHGR